MRANGPHRRYSWSPIMCTVMVLVVVGVDCQISTIVGMGYYLRGCACGAMTRGCMVERR